MCQNINFLLALSPSKAKSIAKWQSQNTIASHDNHDAINGQTGTCPEGSKYIEA
jgi:hypothetical protein